MVRRVWLALCLLLIAPPVFAQSDVVVVLAADEDVLYAGDTSLIQVIVLNAQNSTPPKIDWPSTFTAEALPRQDSSSSFTSIINGRRTERREVRYLYPFRIYASKTGRYTIGPARVNVGGIEYVSEPLTVTVREPEPRDDMKLELALDKSVAYVGEPVTLTLTWLIRNNVRGFEFALPSLPDRIDVYDAIAPTPTSHDIRNQRYFEVEFLGSTILAERSTRLIDGQTWTTLSLQKTLIPNCPGQMVIGPAIVRSDVQVGRRRTNLMFGDDGVYERAVAPSNSVTLAVAALPAANRPPDFSGLVGAYQISARLASTQMKVGDPVKLTVRVNGAHPVERVARLDLLSQSQLGLSFQLSPDDVSSRVEGASFILEATVRPLSHHVTELPPIRLSYFDPELGEYRVASSEPQRITVEETRIVTIDDAIGGGRAAPEAIRSIEGGLAHNYTTEEALIDQRFDLSGAICSPVVIATVAAPPALWGVATLVLAARRRPRQGEGRRRRQASINARRAIQDAESPTMLAAALRTYLHQRHDASPTVTAAEAEARFAATDPETAAALRRLFERLDEAQFAGAGAVNLDSLRREANGLVEQLEKSERGGGS